MSAVLPVHHDGAIATLRCHEASCSDNRIWKQARYQTGAA